jgi:hypothetical protein
MGQRWMTAMNDRAMNHRAMIGSAMESPLALRDGAAA